MKEKIYYIAFDRYEQGTVINALNEMRDRLNSEDRYTDDVDGLIIKICNAKPQNLKSYKECALWENHYLSRTATGSKILAEWKFF